MTRGDGFCLPNQQFTVVAGTDALLQPFLQRGAEECCIEPVDSAVHEAKAIGGANRGSAGEVDDGPPMDGHHLRVTTMALPGIGKQLVDGCQD
jgi:hypothetical protein